MPSLDDHRKTLFEQLQKHQPRTPASLGIRDPYVLMSCLQKASRRADGYNMFGAAFGLLAIDPARFWRRLVIIAFEDFGRTDLIVTAEIVAAASSKRWRLSAGGDWHIASLLLEKLVVLPRDRFLDDLITIAIAIRSLGFVLQRSNSPETPIVDALLATAVGLVDTCQQRVPGSSGWSVLAGRCDGSLCGMQEEGMINADMLEVCLQGRRTSQCLLPVLLPLWLGAVRDWGDARPIVKHGLPPAVDVGGLPSWVYDGYTRMGRAALWKLYDRHRRLQELTAHWPTMPARIDALQSLLFEVEAGIATESLSHPLAVNLQARGRGCGSGLAGDGPCAAFQAVHDAIPQLNDIRQELWRSNLTKAAVLL